MNPAIAPYTPLECLLLFQSLVTYGTDDKSFIQISDLLTNNAFVKDDDTYDAARLRSESLRELYLRLLRDEMKAEEEGQEDGSQTGSKKRKIASPVLPTIKEAAQFKDKLPNLVDRLYARYMISMIEAIREDERRYAILQREVEEIKSGEWDERILKEDKTIPNRNGTVSPNGSWPKINGAGPAPPPGKGVEVPKSQPSKEQPTKPLSPVLAPQKELRPEGLAISDVLNSRESTRPSSPQVTDPKSNAVSQNVLPPMQYRPTSNGPHGPSPLQPPSPQQGQLPTSVQQPGLAYRWEPPYGPPHHPQPYQHGPAYPPQFNPQQYPPQPYPQPARGSFASPQGLQHPHVPSSPLSAQQSHQVVLPPPSGGHRSPESPHGMPLDALADAAGQRYRATSGSPMMQAPPMQGPLMQPPPGGFATPYPPQQRPLSGNGPPQWSPSHMPQYQGPPHPGAPYLGPPPQQYPFQPPNQRQYPPPPSLIPPDNRPYTSPYNANQGPRPTIAQNLAKPRPSQPSTPLSQGQSRFLTGSGTKWTPNPTGSTPGQLTLADRPAMEPLSPILRPAKPPSSKKNSNKQTPQPDSKPIKPSQKRGAQRTRAGSTASSVITESYRSQSVASHADELSRDNAVKEEVATPLPLPSGLEDENGDTTADEALPNIRRRHSNITTSSSRLKRKRNDSVVETPREPTGPATHVLWTRAFPKISASTLEAITGHRNASMFAAPITNRLAAGYPTIILRPQNLKTIKSAIAAGHRAATAAVPDDVPSAQSSVWLPISEDLTPPKGIINYAQLEKELMRMFANAIMFNADPDRGLGGWCEEMKGRGKKGGEGYEIDEDGVVKDTTAMYADVEKIVGSLRSAERRSEEMMGTAGMRVGSVVRESSVPLRDSSVMGEGEDEPDELAGDADAGLSNTGTVAKRRRKA